MNPKDAQPDHRNRIYPSVLAGLLFLSLIGLGISVWAHLEALSGVDPGGLLSDLWLFELLLLALLLPLAAEMVAKRNASEILRSPPWMKRALYVFLLYYGLNFYVFLYWSVDHLDSCVTWRMFSSGWLLLFAITAVYYKVRLSESR